MQTTVGTVESVEKEYADLQILEISGREYRAICYKELVGSCCAGDVVKLNIEATQMQLGTGGYDFVICKLSDGVSELGSEFAEVDPEFAEVDPEFGELESELAEVGSEFANCGNESAVSLREAADSFIESAGNSGESSGSFECKTHNPKKPQSKIMKLRYTPLQCAVDTIEDEHSPLHNKLRDITTIDGMPVACCGLHSQVPLVAAGIKCANPAAKIVYCMTDEASLVFGFSNIGRQCKETGLIDATITCGQATGGDYEAVSLYSGLVAAYAGLGADAIIVAIGPGIAGTSTALGNGGYAQAQSINAVSALGGNPVAVMRVSFGDRRKRHRGVSHHFLTALGQLALARACVCYPAQLDKNLQNVIFGQLDSFDIASKHNLVAVDMRMDGEDVDAERVGVADGTITGANATASVDNTGNDGGTVVTCANSVDNASNNPTNAAAELASKINTRGIKVTTMGRGFAQDPWFFLTAYSAGLHIGRHIGDPDMRLNLLGV